MSQPLRPIQPYSPSTTVSALDFVFDGIGSFFCGKVTDRWVFGYHLASPRVATFPPEVYFSWKGKCLTGGP